MTSLNGCQSWTAFSPNGGGLSLVLQNINSAKKSVHVLAYAFTEPSVGRALLDAHKRGVSVYVVVDESSVGKANSMAKFLASNGVDVKVIIGPMQHNKVVLVDGHTVQTGSFNFSRAAENSNMENVLVIGNCPVLYQQYQSNFELIESRARTLSPSY
jgi:phosphatidylserine/phosphatidylglycerophosphate/cardiolipin synthase-like enzyme